jgi:hypothetical protein
VRLVSLRGIVVLLFSENVRRGCRVRVRNWGIRLRVRVRVRVRVRG